MRKALVYIVVPLLFVGFIIYILYYSFFIINFDKDKIVYNLQNDRDNIPVAKYSSRDLNIKKLYNIVTNKKNYDDVFLPYNMFSLQLSNINKITPTNYKYPIRFKDLSEVQIFCLKEGLKKYKIKYILLKDNKVVNLVLYFKNKDKLTRLSKYLKEYKINLPI